MKFLLPFITALLLAMPVAAADYPQAAGEIKADAQKAKEELKDTEKAVLERGRNLKNRLAEVSAQLEAERARLEQARKDLAETSRLKAELGVKLEEQSGDLKELAGHVRAAARELLALAERSPVTAEDPAKLEALRAYLNKSRFPGLEDIKKLVEMHFDQMNAGGKVQRRKGKLVNRAGREVDGDLVRLGEFSTLYKSGDELGYLTLGQGTGRLISVGGEPSWRLAAALDDFLSGNSDSVPLDISGGAALRSLSRKVGLWDQLLSGGPLIWPILLVGFISLLLIIERLVFLRRVRANTDELMEKVNDMVRQGDFDGAMEAADAQKGRPTSNVLKAGLSLKGAPAEVIENGLAEAMLKELPRLERFLTALKVLAAVAPLLGLLGTVTGMINTFHVITVFGTGDPRLMAGGISEALVTTQLGLSVAIPVLVCASLLSRKAQRIVGDMEEKSVALSAALIQEAA